MVASVEETLQGAVTSISDGTVSLDSRSISSLSREVNKGVDTAVKDGYKAIVTLARNTIKESRDLLSRTIRKDINVTRRVVKVGLNRAYSTYRRRVSNRFFNMDASEK